MEAGGGGGGLHLVALEEGTGISHIVLHLSRTWGRDRGPFNGFKYLLLSLYLSLPLSPYLSLSFSLSPYITEPRGFCLLEVFHR